MLAILCLLSYLGLDMKKFKTLQFWVFTCHGILSDVTKTLETLGN